MSFVFIYKTFLDYYSNPANTLQLTSTIDVWYYVNIDKYNGEWKLTSDKSSSYITINGNNVYITRSKSDWLFFHIPRIVEGKHYGDHFSLGFKKGTRKTIGLHFTTQNEEDGKAEHDSQKRCFFDDGVIIEDILNLQCQQPSGGLLHEHFTSDEVEIIADILQRPFVVSGGSKNMHHKHRGKMYQIIMGKHGGKYILFNGAKRYIKK